MPGVKLPRSAHPRTLANYGRQAPVSAALLLFVVLIVIRVLKTQRAPDKREAGGMIAMAVLVVLSAAVLPDVLVAFLGALAIIAAADASTQLRGALAKVTGALGGKGATAYTEEFTMVTPTERAQAN